MLNPLISKPVVCDSGDVSGRLDCLGSVPDNEFMFMFIFNREEEMVPVVVYYEVNHQKFQDCLVIPDKNNTAYMMAPKRPSNFKVTDGITVTAIEPLISIRPVWYNPIKGS
jgi:hypothetical protein